MSNVKVHNIFVSQYLTLGLRLIKKRKNVMMGQFLSKLRPGSTRAGSFKACRPITKKCLRFFLYLSLVFFIHIFKNVFNSLESYNYCTTYCTTLCGKIRNCVFVLFFTTECIFTTLLKVHFFYLEKITLYYIVRYRWYCQTMTAILTVLPSLKITPPN